MHLRYQIWRATRIVRLLHRDIEILRDHARQIDPWVDPEALRLVEDDLQHALHVWYQAQAKLRILHARRDHGKRQTGES